ncbi:hypothetical protein [Kingella oralis]|uniref:hypothetical protein n=1 Tax=Kingella oralis TaxID=505 RepID=UPI002D7E46F2|nr:hypothetical protein [Kingella oralis]
MPRHILTTALFATSLALAAPALAAPKIAKPADAQTHPQKQPENSNPLQIAQHIQTKDLIGVWANSAETDGGSLLTITMMGTDSKGLDIMLIELKKPQKSLLIMQNFTWQFNEKTQEFTQRVTDFSTILNNGTPKQEKSKIGKTDTAKVQMALLDGKPFMFEFIYKSTGEKHGYFKQDADQLNKYLHEYLNKQALN